MPDGSDAYLFSSYDEESIDLHFKWMRDYDIDGAFMVRFVIAIKDSVWKKQINKVMESALKAARKYDRAISILYDLSASSQPEDFSALENDWKELQTLFAVTDRKQNPTYLWHNNRPLVWIWGVGFRRRTPASEMQEVIANFKKDHEVSIMLGVPFYWRTLTQDAGEDPALLTLIVSTVDIVQPWSVGRLNMDVYDVRAAELSADIQWCRDRQVDYVPCVFPGFSWANLMKNDKYDQIPRLKGDFMWRQVAGAKAAGASSLFVAMFDEINEGTAIFKCAEEGNLPLLGEGKRFVGIEQGLGSDYYLWLTGEAAKWFHGNTGYNATKPQRTSDYKLKIN